MNELVKYKTDAGQELQLTADDVRNMICKDATDKEIGVFLQKCKAQKLNPFIGDCYLVKYNNSPASMITGKEVFTKRAAQHKEYEGFDAGVVFIDKSGNVKSREGSAIYRAAGETLVGGWCRVYINGRRPFYDEVTLEEYSTGKSGWAKMPATMIRKVAIVHALREAFPESFQGLYAAEEMGKQGEAIVEVEAQQESAQPAQAASVLVTAADFVEIASEAQEEQIARLAVDFAEMRAVSVERVKEALYASNTMKQAGAEIGAELTAEQADAAIAVLSGWVEKAAAEQPSAAQAALENARVTASPEYYEQDVAF